MTKVTTKPSGEQQRDLPSSRTAHPCSDVPHYWHHCQLVPSHTHKHTQPQPHLVKRYSQQLKPRLFLCSTCNTSNKLEVFYYCTSSSTKSFHVLCPCQSASPTSFLYKNREPLKRGMKEIAKTKILFHSNLGDLHNWFYFVRPFKPLQEWIVY